MIFKSDRRRCTGLCEKCSNRPVFDVGFSFFCLHPGSQERTAIKSKILNGSIGHLTSCLEVLLIPFLTMFEFLNAVAWFARYSIAKDVYCCCLVVVFFLLLTTLSMTKNGHDTADISIPLELKIDLFEHFSHNHVQRPRSRLFRFIWTSLYINCIKGPRYLHKEQHCTNVLKRDDMIFAQKWHRYVSCSAKSQVSSKNLTWLVSC